MYTTGVLLHDMREQLLKAAWLTRPDVSRQLVCVRESLHLLWMSPAYSMSSCTKSGTGLDARPHT